MEFGGGNATIREAVEISADSYPPDDFESLRASGSIPANLIDKINRDHVYRKGKITNVLMYSYKQVQRPTRSCMKQ